MNPPDEEAPKLVATEGQLPGAVAGAHDDLEEQLHATLKDLQRTNHQSKPAEVRNIGFLRSVTVGDGGFPSLGKADSYFSVRFCLL
jgi:hypothetical protein